MTIRSVAARVSICVVAGAIGAGVSLLCAPYSGRRTRCLLRRKAQQYIRDARDAVTDRTEDLYIWSKQATVDNARRLRRKLHVHAAA